MKHSRSIGLLWLSALLACTGSMHGADDPARSSSDGDRDGPAAHPTDGHAGVAPDASTITGDAGVGRDAELPAPDPETPDGGGGGAGASAYAEPIALPPCDPAAPGVRFIRRASDFGSLDDAGARVFCVEPGTYDVAPVLTASGTASAPRVLRAYVPEDPEGAAHPVHLGESSRAVLRGLTLRGGDHWIIDGLVVRGSGTMILLERGGDSDHVTFQRMLIEGGGGGRGQLAIQGSNDHTLIQNSVLRRTDQEPGRDKHCIKVVGPVQGTRIVANEIYDCSGDGLQIGNGGGLPDDRVEGVLVADNDFYITPAMWTDCRGNLDPGGSCACSENAIDIKGTTDAEDPVPMSRWARILDNRMWGYKTPDEGCGTSGGITTAVVLHWEHTDNVLFRGNVIMHAGGGFAIPDASLSGGEEGEHISVVENLFYDIDHPNGWAIDAKEALRVEYYYNTIVSARSYIRMRERQGYSDFRCNVIIEGGSTDGSWPDSSDGDYNAYYGTSERVGPGGHDLATGADAHGNADHCLFITRITDPTRECIPGAVTTAASPHATLCAGANAGARRNIGIDDATYTRASAGFE